ncbi:beta-galactosidase trimerization domain-containing protein [Sphingobium sp. H39-3-25]|uniref:beta-galactosidase trimerization domain-containing protein n=1 Tax=Sphingobium arseniciresistens TaxID=3030834 RepID=UPI0023B9A605|nr:beta-galactosidase trimerization domain-containing protein [Sphingobium arseniciresistens]
MSTTRRKFTAAGLGGMVALISEGLPGTAFAASRAPGSTTPPWYHSIKRIGQTNFNELDPAGGDVEAWADFWASAKVQAVALSVSGPVAFYPTEVPHFQISKALAGRDLFGECLTAAKKRGIRVFGRMSPDIQYVTPELLTAHPDWLRREKDGALKMSAPDIAFTCQMTGQFREQQPAILNELVDRYDIDGVYMNGWPMLQECYCSACRAIGDPRSDRYKALLMDDAARLVDIYRSIVTRKKPDNFYSCNIIGGMDDAEIDQWKLTRNALWYTSDNQSRRRVDDPVWQASQQTKYAHAMMGSRPVAAVTGSYTRSGRTMWRHVADTSFEPRIRMAQTAAAGGIVWYHHLGLIQGFSGDRRWQQPGREFLSWQAANEPHFQNIRSLANVAVVLPTNTMGNQAKADGPATDHLQGFYAALNDARIMSDFVHENDLTPERLAQYDLLILPNFARMSDAQAAALEAFARRGGSLLATYRTGLMDEKGNPRREFALGSLFGIALDGEVTGQASAVLDSFAPISLQMVRSRGPLSEGFEDTEWIAGPSKMQPIKPVAGAPFTFIDPYPVYPPEAVYPRKPPADRPAVVLREARGARFCYLAGDMDATYWRLDNPDLGAQLVNVIRWLLRDRLPATVTGSGLMEIFGWQTKAGYALHLLNYNGANAYRGHMRAPVDLGPQTVRFRLPAEASVTGARLLSAGTTLPLRQSGRTIELTVPKVGLYEVIALEV